jgi:lysyl-tRNA synthetase class I
VSKYSAETVAAFKEWLPEHAKLFPDVPFPKQAEDRVGIFPGLASILVKNGIVDVDHLFEITRRMLANGIKTYDLQGHIQELIKTAIAYHREVYNPQSVNVRPDPRQEELLARVEKVKQWFDAQDEETKERYRQDAEINPRTNRREQLPFTKAHKYFDDFVCGIIASRNPEFCGLAPE